MFFIAENLNSKIANSLPNQIPFFKHYFKLIQYSQRNNHKNRLKKVFEGTTVVLKNYIIECLKSEKN